MDDKNVINEIAIVSKRRKDKDNTNREISDKQEKKRMLQYQWQQTDSEITIIIQFGMAFHLNDLKLDCNDTTINLKLKEFEVWCGELYRPIVTEGTSLQMKGSRLLIKLLKRIPNEHWAHLENFVKYQEMEPVQTDEVEKRRAVEICNLKYDWYEKGLDTLHLHVYIKNIIKDTLQVIFGETDFVMKFQTRDVSFLKLQGLESEDTMCTWKLNLKEAVKSDECKYRLTSNNLDLIFKKKIHQKWGALEAVVQGLSTSVPVNSWVLFPKASSKRQTSLIPDQVGKESAGLEKSGRRSSSGISESGAQGQEKTPVKKSVISTTGEFINKAHNLEMKQNNKESNQKPMGIVLPLSKGKLHTQVVTPGLTGLENLGNTCFMNCVLQCLANTREFRDYFLNGLFQAEINTENPLGTGGKLAVVYAILIKVLWSGTHQSYAPVKLKTLIGMNASQFIGFAQHDAQELMTFLLDGLHEDLNRIRKKPYIESIDYDGRPDEVIAEESWKLYKQRNDSVVVDLFQGQYKSKLVCPVCQKVSITFDPFLYLSVPLPKKQRYLSVYFFSKDPYHRPFKYIVSFPQDGKVEALKEKLSTKTSVQPNNMRIFEVYKNKIHKIFEKGSSLSAIGSNDIVFVYCTPPQFATAMRHDPPLRFEILDEHSIGEPIVELAVVQRMIMPQPVIKCSCCGSECVPGGKLRRCTKCYRAGYCNQGCQKNHWFIHKHDCKEIPELIGSPFLLSLPKSQTTFSNLYRLMEAFSRLSVDVFCPPLQLPGTQKTSLHKEPHSINYVNCSSDFKISSRQHIDKAQNSNCDVIDSNVSYSTSGGTPSTSAASDRNTELFKNSSTSMCALNDSDVIDKKGECNTIKEDSLYSNKICSASSEASSKKSIVEHPQQPLLRVVLGHQHENVNFVPPLFLITPVNQHGENFQTDKHLEDKADLSIFWSYATSDGWLYKFGSEALDLSSYYYFAMDWNNNEKTRNYVLVESKELECDSEEISEIKTTEAMGVTLEQCLHLFTEPEILSPQEAWYCPHCIEHREATKQLSLWRLPPVLIIQLKRFSFKNLLWREKIDHIVEFPVRNLDLKPYSCGPVSEAFPVYDLFGVINHHGGILGGHYTTFARCADIANSCKSEVDWRLFDDSRVTFVSENRVMTREAYMLFYRQRGVPFNINPCATNDSLCKREHKKKDNLFNFDLRNETDLNSIKLEYNFETDSNILTYTTNEADKSSTFNEMDMVD